MGEAKRRRHLGLVHARRNPPKASGLTFDQALELAEREGKSCWTWIPRERDGLIVGADTFISYRDDDDDESSGEAYVSVEGDYWDMPEIGEQDDLPMRDVKDELGEAVWHKGPAGDRFDLPDFSFLKLRELGCTDEAVLKRAREFDRND